MGRLTTALVILIATLLGLRVASAPMFQPNGSLAGGSPGTAGSSSNATNGSSGNGNGGNSGISGNSGNGNNAIAQFNNQPQAQATPQTRSTGFSSKLSPASQPVEPGSTGGSTQLPPSQPNSVSPAPVSPAPAQTGVPGRW